MKTAKHETVGDYVASFPPDVQSRLKQMRRTIKQAAPEAEETISYGMPAYRLHGPLVYFAAMKGHIGFYATPTGNAAFADELAGYTIGKGSIQFPLDAKLPLDLVTRIVAFRVQENLAKAAKPKKARTRKAAPAKTAP